MSISLVVTQATFILFALQFCATRVIHNAKRHFQPKLWNEVILELLLDSCQTSNSHQTTITHSVIWRLFYSLSMAIRLERDWVLPWGCNWLGPVLNTANTLMFALEVLLTEEYGMDFCALRLPPTSRSGVLQQYMSKNTKLEYHVGINHWNTKLEYHVGISSWKTILEDCTGIQSFNTILKYHILEYHIGMPCCNSKLSYHVGSLPRGSKRVHILPQNHRFTRTTIHVS